MSVSQLANTPMEITFGGRKLTVSRMPLSELYGPAEQRIVSNYRNNMLSIASTLTGKEKMDYLTQATRDIPSGAALLAAAQDYIGTPEGYFDLILRALSKHQKIEEGELLQIITTAKQEEQVMMLSYVMGTDFEVAKKAMEQAEEDSKKK